MWLHASLLSLLILVPARVQTPLTVSAAVSLTEALEAVARAYASAGGRPVRFNFAGSNVLARQLVNGAPADLFISADEAQMDVAMAAGVIDGATRVDLLANRLAVIARPERLEIGDVRALLGPGVRRVAIGDPAAVPAGVYARQYLEAVGLWDALQAKLVPVGNVRAAVAAVENGSADAAIVYETDAAVARTAVTRVVVSGAGAPRVVYPAAIVAGSRQRESAAHFLAFLRGSDASEIFRRYKFTPLAR